MSYLINYCINCKKENQSGGGAFYCVNSKCVRYGLVTKIVETGEGNRVTQYVTSDGRLIESEINDGSGDLK